MRWEVGSLYLHSNRDWALDKILTYWAKTVLQTVASWQWRKHLHTLYYLDSCFPPQLPCCRRGRTVESRIPRSRAVCHQKASEKKHNGKGRKLWPRPWVRIARSSWDKSQQLTCNTKAFITSGVEPSSQSSPVEQIFKCSVLPKRSHFLPALCYFRCSSQIEFFMRLFNLERSVYPFKRCRWNPIAVCLCFIISKPFSFFRCTSTACVCFCLWADELAHALC